MPTKVFSLGCKQRFHPLLVQFYHHWREANETMWSIFGAKPKVGDRSVPNNSESWVQVKSSGSHAKRSCHICSSKTLIAAAVIPRDCSKATLWHAKNPRQTNIFFWLKWQMILIINFYNWMEKKTAWNILVGPGWNAMVHIFGSIRTYQETDWKWACICIVPLKSTCHLKSCRFHPFTQIFKH